MATYEKTALIPQFWYYYQKNYFEIRYNYEDDNTASFYYGRSITLGKKQEFAITPIVGFVFGKTNGLSAGYNLDLNSEIINTFSQGQYTFDLKISDNKYLWNWKGIILKAAKHLGVGGSSQVLVSANNDSFLHFGPMLMFDFNKLIIETFAYNFWKKNNTVVLGIKYNFPLMMAVTPTSAEKCN